MKALARFLRVCWVYILASVLIVMFIILGAAINPLFFIGAAGVLVVMVIVVASAIMGAVHHDPYV